MRACRYSCMRASTCLRDRVFALHCKCVAKVNCQLPDVHKRVLIRRVRVQHTYLNNCVCVCVCVCARAAGSAALIHTRVAQEVDHRKCVGCGELDVLDKREVHPLQEEHPGWSGTAEQDQVWPGAYLDAEVEEWIRSGKCELADEDKRKDAHVLVLVRPQPQQRTQKHAPLLREAFTKGGVV